MKLTDKAIKHANTQGKERRKLFDGGGLHLLVTLSGGKYWRFRYRFNGADRTLSLGTYPNTSLKMARQQHRAARTLLDKGIDPHAHKIQQKTEYKRLVQKSVTFEHIANEWFARREPSYTNKKAAQQVINTLRQYAFPVIGKQAINRITVAEILTILDPIIASKPETANRLKQRISNVFDYAIHTELAINNPMSSLPKIVRNHEHRVKHHPALPVDRIGEFFNRLAAYPSQKTQLALRLLILTLTRSGELRYGQWQELQNDEWRIPAERMKMKRAHVVPLSDWALVTLHELRSLNKHNSKYFVTGNRNQPISDMTLSQAMKRIGYAGIAVPHGFRAMASTILNESGLFNPDAIERQLAHVDKNSIRAAYNRAEYANERRKMMQWYSDFIRSKCNIC